MVAIESRKLDLNPQKVLSFQERKLQNLETAARACSLAAQNVRFLRREAIKDGVIDFDKTQRDRTFFAPHPEAEVHPLARSLFGSATGSDLKQLQKIVNGKKILTIGGGRSLGDITSSSDFSPTSLVNADPFLSAENLQERAAGKSYYRSLEFDPTKSDFQAALAAEGYDTFDEIWATFSLPCYCKTNDEVETFFKNSYQLLNDGGTLRVFPLGFRVEPMANEDYEKRITDLKAGIASALDLLAVKNDVTLTTVRDYSYASDQPYSALLVHKTQKTPGFE